VTRTLRSSAEPGALVPVTAGVFAPSSVLAEPGALVPVTAGVFAPSSLVVVATAVK
jgi:prefoldin subunit 5